jgi:hypothetical protein
VCAARDSGLTGRCTADLGAPLACAADDATAIVAGDSRIEFQPFADGILWNRIPDWEAVQSLSGILRGTLPAAGTLAYQLIEASFSASLGLYQGVPGGAVQFHPDWLFHQTAILGGWCVPLSPNRVLTQDNGQRCAVQVFSGDTLFSPGPPYAEVRKLSELPESDPLHSLLWDATYAASGAGDYRSSPFHSFACQCQAGAPLSGVYAAAFEGRELTIQVFARDTLYREGAGAIRRMRDLPKPAWIARAAIQPPLVSRWLEQHPHAPPPARALIELALSLLGLDSLVLPTLNDQARKLMAWSEDIVCADLVSICLDHAGLPLDWRVTEPPGTQYTSPRAANFYRPHASHPRLREVGEHEDWLPGDILVYAVNPAGEYHHVNLYVGKFTGIDSAGRLHADDQGFDVVNADMFSEQIKPLTSTFCINNHFRTSGFTTVRRMRHRDLESIYQHAGFI